MQLEELARKIRARREKLGLKQLDIANALRISPQAVSKWERGENAPDISVLVPLSRLLDVTADWLLSSEDQRTDSLEATVLVTGVKGTYERSRRMDARSFAIWANGMFYSLTELTLHRGGVPIKYLGDQYLAFFSGTDHRRRALETALEARKALSEDLRVGLASGEIYVGAAGHPEYARPDIMGEVVNATFLTREWAETDTESGVAATIATVGEVVAAIRVGQRQEIRFDALSGPLTLCEVWPLGDGSE
jgi:transcriptional regulator with XRE-family HTH domain